MATIKELRLRIKSLQNTSKITSAMKMVSASRLRRAQDAFNRARPYYQKMQELLDQVVASFQDLDHPLMKSREAKRLRYYALASDRGLAGPFNNNLLRFFTRQLDSTVPLEAVGLGKRARDFVARSGLKVSLAAEGATNLPNFANASRISSRAIHDFTTGEVDKVFLVYNRYNSVLSQTPTTVQLLPFTKPAAVSLKDGATGGFKLDYVVEPNPEELFNELLPQLVAVQVFRSLLENAVGEHSARMTAMDSATKNTKDLISNLTLRMNRARQAAITKELIEIVSGAEALNG